MSASIVVIIEGIKVLIQSAVALAKAAGMTKENTKEIFEASWDKLKDRDPADLPDV